MMDYKLIAAMAAVVQEGGFDKAAKALALTQSAVSQRIRLLEEQTGQILLIRSTPPAVTDAGARLMRHWLQVRRLEADFLEPLTSQGKRPFETLAIGVNADSIATWFMDAVIPFLKTEQVVLDVRVDDQDQTHALLKKGDVLGCISSLDRPVQGCSIARLGAMTYRMLASREFTERWFPDGIEKDAVRRAPLLVFNRKDRLQERVLEAFLGSPPGPVPTHYLPSSEKFVDAVCAGIAYGMLPDLQSRSLVESGTLVELLPLFPVQVVLYWHCWNLKSPFIERFSRHLADGARKVLF